MSDDSRWQRVTLTLTWNARRVVSGDNGMRGVVRLDLANELRQSRNFEGIKALALARDDRHAHAAGRGMDAERALEQVVDLSRDLVIETGVAVLEDDVTLDVLHQRSFLYEGAGQVNERPGFSNAAGDVQPCPQMRHQVPIPSPPIDP